MKVRIRGLNRLLGSEKKSPREETWSFFPGARANDNGLFGKLLVQGTGIGASTVAKALFM